MARVVGGIRLQSSSANQSFSAYLDIYALRSSALIKLLRHQTELVPTPTGRKGILLSTNPTTGFCKSAAFCATRSPNVVTPQQTVTNEIRYLRTRWQRVINLISACAETTPLTFSSGGIRAPQYRHRASRASSLYLVSRICGSYLPEANR